MKALIVASSLFVCTAAYAQDIDPPAPAPVSPDVQIAPDQQNEALSDDIAAGHDAPPADEPPPSPKRTPFVGSGRQGFTFEVALGAGYTDEHAFKGIRLSALENFGVGAFVARDLALLFRLGASLTGRWSSGSYDDEGTIRRSHTSRVVDQLYVMPAAEYFLNDRFMVSGGIGPTIVLRSTNTAVDETANGASSEGSHAWGAAGEFRFGVTLLQGRNVGALRLSALAVPSIIQHDWHIVTGLIVEGQLY